MKFTRLQKKKVPRTLKRSFLIITVSLMITFGIGAAVISYVIFSDSLRSNLYLLRQAVDKPFEHALIKTHPGLGWSIEE